MNEKIIVDLLAQLPSTGSRRVYGSVWRRYLAWCAEQSLVPLDARPRHISAHLVALRDAKKSKATIAQTLSVLREIYGAFVREEKIPTNPAREVKAIKVSSVPSTPWLDEDQVRALLALPATTWAGCRDRLAVCLLLGLGWRRTEVARMQVEDFDLERATVTGTVKGGKTLTAGVPAWLGREIERWYAYAGITSGALLPRAPLDSRSITGDMVYEAITRMSKRLGFKVTPHALRRTYITLSGQRGVSLRERQLAVGHVSGSTTERYDHARDAAQNAPGRVLEDLIGGEK